MMTRGTVAGITRRIPAERLPDGTVYIVRQGKAYPASDFMSATFIAFN